MDWSNVSQRAWAAVEFEVAGEQEELATWLVMHCGASGCEIKPLGNARVLIQAIFDQPQLEDKDVSSIGVSLEEYGLAACLNSLRVKTILEEDWLAMWKKGFQPFVIGSTLLVCPPWSHDTLDDELVAQRRVLILEPGMAFGTGLHETTRYCLVALECMPVGQNVLDVGTGSGILAIGAALLYPDVQIVAVDIDPVAIKVAQENIELNGVGNRIELIDGGTEVLESQIFECILSNLTCEDIMALLPEYLRLLRPNGTVICAGILKEKLPRLESALENYPLLVVDRQVHGEWVGVTLKRLPVEVCVE
ncbi:MAG: 50S ribosomal protein L11 methyltransferase [Candidatus Melainabacteria bacterium]|nr:50S ribosomal protein L11 methyltransferase [Candidatus Melainabacteria bacterium]